MRRHGVARMDQENAAAHVIGESIGYGERSGKNVCGHDERADPPEEEQGHDPEGLPGRRNGFAPRGSLETTWLCH